MKVDSPYEETQKQFSDPTTIPKIAKYSPKGPIWIGTKNASQRNTQKMKVDSLYEKTQKQCSDPTQTQKWVIIKNALKEITQKTKDFILNIETLKQYSDLTPPLQQPTQPQRPNRP